jgi:hypothetical protein
MASRLTDMQFDEVSFVPRGANQKARVALWKADQEPEEVERPMAIVESTAELLMNSDPNLTRAQAVSKVLKSCPDLYEADLEHQAKTHASFEKGLIAKHMEKLGVEFTPATEASIAKADERLETVAKSIQQRDGGTYAQAVLTALENDPELYQP